MEIANILFSWFKHKFIYPDVRALNATIIVHSTLKSIVGKKYCVWRWQMNYLADSSTSPYVLMLERWMLPFSYIQRPTVLLERELCMKISNELFTWIYNESICPNVRVLNAAIFVHSTLKSIVGKKYCVWRWQMNYLADSSTSPYVLMLERWMLPFSYIQRPTVLLERELCMKISNELFTWIYNESICPNVRVLNAAIFVHSTPVLLVRKQYYW